MEEAKPKVVVTTKHRGVFYGRLEDKRNGEVVLSDARLCVYWTQETRGFIGLAATGPLDGSRVSRSIPKLEIVDVTSISHCSEDAVRRWEAGPWS